MLNTNRLRIGFALTAIIGAIYAAAGLFDSLTHFSTGVIVTSLAVIGVGLVDYCEARTNQRIIDARAAVWARRDRQANL